MLLLNKLLGPYLTEPRLEKTRSFSLKKDKPKIKRQPSTNVSDQQRGDCWNYSCCRVIVRLIFNVLTIKEEDNEECDLWYININNLKIDEVKEKCIKNEDNSSYKKILLYLFLICVGYTKYLCNGTGDGQDPANVFKFFTKTILNNPNFKESKRVKEIQHNLFDLDFDTIIFPMITAFQEKTKLNCVTKQLKSFENLDEIRSVLDNGLYMVIGVSLGKSPAKNRKAFGEYEEGKYRKAFDEYEEGKKRPVASSIESKGGGHAMTIVKYNNIKNKKYIFFDEIDPDLIQLTIKNSWGNKWGINGTIDILSYELKTLCSVLDWVEPEDKTILSSIDQFEAIPRRKISDINELEIIDETDKIYIEKCYAFIKSLANDDGNINGQTLSKMYFVFFDVLPLTHERPDPMIKLVKYINNNDDINIDIDSFVERIYDTRCTYTYFDVRDDITPHKFKDLADKIKTTIHLPEKEKSDIAEKIRTVDLQKALDKMSFTASRLKVR